VSITVHNDVSKGEVPARRLEIFTGAGRRRTWTTAEKAAIVAETYEDGVRTSDVARRHGLTPQQLFGWRRAACRRGDHEIEAPTFAPVVLDAPSGVSLLDAGDKTPTIEARPHSIELEVEGSSVWIWRGADPAMVTTIIAALKAGR
jgi:transposase